MREKNSKRFTAVLLAAALAVSSSVTAYANEALAEKGRASASEISGEMPEAEGSQTQEEAEGNQIQEGTEAEGDSAKEGVVQVVLPTSAVGIFDFILDPQRLISQTDGAAYGGKKFEEGATLFFERTSKEVEEDYTSDSDAIAIANRGTAPVDVAVKATVSVSMADGLAMTDDREFTDDTRASLYLALTDGETVVPITFEEGATIQTVVPADAMDGKGENVYSFWLTGACNEKGDWYALKDMEIGVTVDWMIIPREENLPEGLEEALPASEPSGSDTAATPSEATPSDAADKGVAATSSEATPSDAADKDVIAVPSEAASRDGKKDVAAATPSDMPTGASPKDAAAVN